MKRSLDQAALDRLANAINNSIDNDGRYGNLAEVRNYLSRTSPDLNTHNYGYDRLKDSVEASSIVDFEWLKVAKGPPVCLVCPKANAGELKSVIDYAGCVLGVYKASIFKLSRLAN